jgi:hypothetical protein
VDESLEDVDHEFAMFWESNQPIRSRFEDEGGSSKTAVLEASTARVGILTRS